MPCRVCFWPATRERLPTPGIDSYSRVDESVTVGSCKIDRIIFADDLVLLAVASFQQGLQHTLDQFFAASDRAGMKISTKNTGVWCLSRNPRQCMLQVNGNTLQQVKKFKYLGVVLMSRVTECGARRLLHGLVKQMQFRVSIIALWSRNGSFQMPQSCQFLNRSVFRSLPMVMNLG